MERSSQQALDGVEEWKGAGGDATTVQEQSNRGNVVTLYVTVHSGGDSKIIPFHFSPEENMMQVKVEPKR